MGMYDWESRYSVGVSDMDEHHKKLFDIVSRVHEAVRGNQAEDRLDGLIGELLDYTQYHFREEETMLQRAGFPRLAEHQAQHRKFIDDLQAFRKEAKGGMTSSAAFKVLNTSVAWLRNHILKQDMEYKGLATS
jgi:hemerythrin